MTGTDRIADFVYSYDGEDAPPEVFEKVRLCIADYVCTTLAGFSQESAKIVTRLVRAMGGSTQSRVWGARFKTSPCLAALANGTAAHALDYDDADFVMMGHPSIQLLPGLFALAESEHKSGSHIIESFLVGFEVGSKLGMAVNPHLVERGWFPVGTLGVIMQAAACSRLLGLKKSHLKMALGIAVNMASGVRCNNGTMAKPFVSGHIGFNGILATLLAREGMTANERALEDRFGFIDSFAGHDPVILSELTHEMGRPLEITRSTIMRKLYPFCTGTHAPIEAVFDIVGTNLLDPSQIDEVKVQVSPILKHVLIHPKPRNDLEARFSLEYAVARAILDREMGMEQISLEKVRDPLVLTLMEKVKPIYEDASGGQTTEKSILPARVEIVMKTGKRFVAWKEQPRGTSEDVSLAKDLENKFFNCCEGLLPRVKIAEIVDRLKHFEEIDDIADFVWIW